jgi:hypothetical protein
MFVNVLQKEVKMMAYVAPELTLIGHAADVVLKTSDLLVFDGAPITASPVRYDFQTFLETEW